MYESSANLFSDSERKVCIGEGCEVLREEYARESFHQTRTPSFRLFKNGEKKKERKQAKKDKWVGDCWRGSMHSITHDEHILWHAYSNYPSIVNIRVSFSHKQNVWSNLITYHLWFVIEKHRVSRFVEDEIIFCHRFIVCVCVCAWCRQKYAIQIQAQVNFDNKREERRERENETTWQTSLI